MHKSMFARILICSMSLAISAVVMLAQGAGSKSAKTDHQSDFLQIITPHEGVDFTGFSSDLVRVVKRNWYAKMPSDAKQNRNIKGRVVVGVGIQKDRQLSDVPKVEVAPGTKLLMKLRFPPLEPLHRSSIYLKPSRGRISIYALRFFTTSLSPR